MFLWLKQTVKQEHELKFKDSELIKERNKIRKILLKETKKVIVLKKQVYKNISVKEFKMAKQAKIEDITIPMFYSANYPSWKIRRMLLLE